MNVVYCHATLRDGYADNSAEDIIGWGIIAIFGLCLTYHFVSIFYDLFKTFYETCLGLYEGYYNSQKNKEHT